MKLWCCPIYRCYKFHDLFSRRIETNKNTIPFLSTYVNSSFMNVIWKMQLRQRIVRLGAFCAFLHQDSIKFSINAYKSTALWWSSSNFSVLFLSRFETAAMQRATISMRNEQRLLWHRLTAKVYEAYITTKLKRKPCDSIMKLLL